MRQATKEAVSKKFGRKRLLASKVVPHYPANLEREYVRVTNAYMTMFKNTLAEHLPDIRALLEQGGARTDAKDDVQERTTGLLRTGDEIAAFEIALEKRLFQILNNFAEKQSLFDLQKRIGRLTNLTRKLTIKEWKRVVKRTLGIDIMEDYYNGLKFQQLLDKWTAKNVGLIKTIPQEALSKMRDVVKAGYLRGANTKSIAREIQDAYGISEYHAQFIARDQMAKLNAKITREQHAGAGVSEYVWRSASDERVRACHKELNNKRFKYSDPPEQWYPIMKNGVMVGQKITGKRANPGEFFQCRCVALPVFDLDTVVLPWEKGTDHK
jgi:SPP1 gp7 family putative phage head morphogenesis protein